MEPIQRPETKQPELVLGESIGEMIKKMHGGSLTMCEMKRYCNGASEVIALAPLEGNPRPPVKFVGSAMVNIAAPNGQPIGQKVFHFELPVDNLKDAFAIVDQAAQEATPAIRSLMDNRMKQMELMANVNAARRNPGISKPA